MPSNGEPLTLFIPVYFDNGLVSSNLIPLYNWFIAELCKEIEVVNLRPTSLTLKVELFGIKPVTSYGSHKEHLSLAFFPLGI